MKTNKQVVQTKEQATNTGTRLANEGKMLGQVSKVADLQAAAVAAYNRRLEEINKTKRQS
jgi:hypothetical protein